MLKLSKHIVKNRGLNAFARYPNGSKKLKKKQNYVLLGLKRTLIKRKKRVIW